ncbi:MAG: BlaI/MecI/CopY family transcriptional regulator [Sedimentisphaerales bacterium]|nr:BlaI/MecI/CopY family transcriptional regulator [Sedimentisphaerales bacterium]
MPNKPKISEAEWEVMKVLWNRSPATANEVISALSDKTAWSPRTVRTLINRLVVKKALGFKKTGRRYHYYPLVSEEASVQTETKSFLERVRGGALKPILAAFLEEQKLTPDEIAELKEILDKS